MSPPEFSDLDCRNLRTIEDHRCNSSSPITPNIPHQITNNLEDQTNNKEDANSVVVSDDLKIQVITSFAREFNNHDHPKTPTSTEHKIPAMATCPPAPRKAKWVPKITGKRKAPYFVAVGDMNAAADFMVYVDAMLALNEVVYVPDIVVGDLGAGDCAKRFKALPVLPADQP
ncbi:hypothetical protein L6452_03524 [Arctium lappa]|uniref:Uncharacterized protein n=1 Tax=Arctium lappa TaxID=4217 RepID=A0ACB9FNC7_ARCLA|nr:hypothetical protein L6452_03524 [Arctium lappa]